MSKKFLTPINLTNLSSDPATGSEGDLYFNTTDNVVKIYVDGAWIELQGSNETSASAFSNITTNPATQTISANSIFDTLTLISGENISIVNASANKSVTINSTGNYTSVDSIAYPDYIVFDTTPENTSASVSTLSWDSGESSLSLQLNADTNVTLGQEIVVKVYNAEASTITKGQVVYLFGAQGQRPSVKLASNASDTTSAKTFGIAAENITSGAEGLIVSQGLVKNINTNGFNEGDVLWLGNTPGSLTTTKPQGPLHGVFVGVVVKKNVSSGRIYVKAQNGYELDELHDVRINDRQDGDLIVYNSASSIWINSPSQNLINTASAAAYDSASAYTYSQINALTTTDIEEGSNLYFTNQRAINAGSAVYVNAASVGNIVADIENNIDTIYEIIYDPEIYQPYVNSASAAAYSAASVYTNSQINALTTTDIEEGSNLYFTNQRAINAGSATYILQADQQSIINTASGAAVTYLVDGAPAALDTLNELAAALNDDASFATTVTNSLAAKLDASTASATYLTITDASATYVAQNATGDEYIQDQAAALFNHAQHVNASATYDDANNRIIITANAGGGGGGGATVAYQTTQPDTASLPAGSLWIDSDQDTISGLLPATFTRWIKVLSASATTISGLDDNSLSLLYTPGYEKVFINGTLLVRGSDYTASTGNTVVLSIAAEATDVIEIHSYESFQIADTYTQAAADAKFFPINESRVDRWTKTYSASATTITGTDDYAESLSYTSGLESLFINGVLVDPSEYTRTSASVITPDEAILSGDVVDIISPKAFDVANTYTIAQIDNKYNNRTRWTKTFSASATVISGVDDNANTLSYTSGYEEVYLNGILLTPITDYARTSASVITLGAAVVTNDIIDVVNIQPFNVADVYTEAESDAKYLTKVSASSTYAPVAAGGLVLINKTTFSGTTSVSINNAFNASYDNYKIIISNLVGDGGTIRLRASGSDDSTSNYMSRAVLIANAAFQANRENSTSSWTISSMSSYGTLTFDLTSPYLTSATNILLSQISAGSSSSGAHLSLGGVHTASTSFDGFTLTGSINISGTVRIYGYRSDV